PWLPSSGTMASTVYSYSLNLLIVDWAFKSSPLVVSTLTFSTIYLDRLVSITSVASFLQDIRHSIKEMVPIKSKPGLLIFLGI
ncbi:MAG: hypothetical protein NWR65_07340, partial [Saprospiraceae bacterium]|nr:hypothetical protein [Saprospiraceae bacterium]